MPGFTVLRGFAAALLMLPTAVAVAQEGEKPTKVTADAAYIKTTGNTEVSTMSGGDKLEHKFGSWLLTQEARAVWGETNGVETAGRYNFGLRADYFLAPRFSTYLLGAWRRDTFSGVSRQFEEGLGVAWKAVAAKPHKLELEAGIGLLQRRTTLDTDEDFGTARPGALYQYQFNEKAYFEARGTYLVNLDDSEAGEMDARFALVAPIAGGLSIKLGYDLYHRNRPQAGLEKLDTTFSSGLQFSY